MKYLTIAILFVLSLGYAGYYLYMFDKRDGTDKSAPIKVTSDASKKDKERDLKSSDQIDLPDHLTKEFWKNVTPEQLKEKLENIKNVNEVRPDDKQNMLHLLVRYGQYPEMVHLLIDAGLDYNHKMIDGAPVLNYVFRRKNKEKIYEFIRELLKYDINVNEFVGQYGITSLGLAAYRRSGIKAIRLLLEKGADPNHQLRASVEDASRPIKPSLLAASVLLLASMPNKFIGESFIDPEVIQLLWDYKVDITIKNKEGKTAWDYMKENEEFTKTDLFKKLSTQVQ